MMNGIPHSNHQQINHLQNQPGHLIQTSSSQGQGVPQQSSSQAWYAAGGRVESGNQPSSSNLLQGQKNNLHQQQLNGIYL